MLADCKLLHFVEEYEKINGQMTITPNMHLHFPLRKCVENYGSIYGFWFFSFEHYNGILGSYQTNNKTVELQIMCKFMTSGIVGNMQYSLPEEFNDFFLFSCISQLESSENSVEIVQPPQFVMASSGPLPGKESIWSDLTPICFEKHYKLGRLDQEEVSALHIVYGTLYPHITVTSSNLPSLYKRYKLLSVCGERYGSAAGRRLCPYARIIASLCDKDGVVHPGMLRPGIIRYFIVYCSKV